MPDVQPDDPITLAVLNGLDLTVAGHYTQAKTTISDVGKTITPDLRMQWLGHITTTMDQEPTLTHPLNRLATLIATCW
jgi:hypothetical protein